MKVKNKLEDQKTNLTSLIRLMSIQLYTVEFELGMTMGRVLQ